MKPLKPIVVIEQTAKELDLDVSLVSDVVHGYYTHIRECLSKPTCSSVYIPKLGTFKMMYASVKRKIEIYDHILNTLNQDTTMNMYARKLSKEADLEVYNRMLVEIEGERQRHRDMKQERYAKYAEEEMSC